MNKANNKSKQMNQSLLMRDISRQMAHYQNVHLKQTATKSKQRPYAKQKKKRKEQNPQRLREMLLRMGQQLKHNRPHILPGSNIGTSRGVLQNALGILDATDMAATTLNSIATSSSGFGITPRLSLSATANIGNTSLSATVDATALCDACAMESINVLDDVSNAMDMGMGMETVESLMDEMIGMGTGALDLLTATFDNMLKDVSLQTLMTGIIGALNKVDKITEPIFSLLLDMTWSENLQWLPDFPDYQDILSNMMPISMPGWMECKQELTEYFDFVQEVMSGAIDQVWRLGNETFSRLVEEYGMLESQTLELIEQGKQFGLPDIDLHIPLMSISKMMMDFQDKIAILKESLRQKAKMILYKLRQLEGVGLTIEASDDLQPILDVLVQIEFVFQNIHTAIDKIIEYFLNVMVEKFAAIARGIIDKIMEIFQLVTEIVPPLQDLLDMCFAIPRAADDCCNIAFNIILPEVWSMVDSLVNDTIDELVDACDKSTQLAFNTIDTSAQVVDDTANMASQLSQTQVSIGIGI